MKHDFNPSDSSKEFPDSEAYRLGNPAVTPSQFEAMTDEERSQAVHESLVATDEHEDEKRLEAAKGIISTIDTLMEGKLRDLGEGEYIGEGVWLLLSQKERFTGKPAEESYAIKRDEVSLYVRRMGDSLNYSVNFSHRAHLTNAPVTIAVGKDGVMNVTTSKRQSRVQFSGDEVSGYESLGEREVPASAALLESVNSTLNPMPESGESLRAFDPEREIIRSHPNYPNQVRVLKKTFLGKIGRGLDWRRKRTS